MGKTRCAKHGTAHFVVACSHVGEQVDGGKLPKCWCATVVVTMFVCDDCVKIPILEKCMRLSEEGRPELGDPRWEVHYDAYAAAYESLENPRIFCSKCIVELEQKS